MGSDLILKNGLMSENQKTAFAISLIRIKRIVFGIFVRNASQVGDRHIPFVQTYFGRFLFVSPLDFKFGQFVDCIRLSNE